MAFTESKKSTKQVQAEMFSARLADYRHATRMRRAAEQALKLCIEDEQQKMIIFAKSALGLGLKEVFLPAVDAGERDAVFFPKSYIHEQKQR